MSTYQRVRMEDTDGFAVQGFTFLKASFQPICNQTEDELLALTIYPALSF